MGKSFAITGGHVSLSQVLDMVRAKQPSYRLSPTARRVMKRSRKFIDDVVEKDSETVYGVNTGFGKLAGKRISQGNLRDLQTNLIRSHAVGVGEPLSDDVVKLMMLLRANSLAAGFSGIRIQTVETLLQMAAKGVYPVVPSQGSVGASGDLAPLAHMTLVMMGEGEAHFNGKRMSGAKAMKQAGIEPVVLAAKEGLALINGTPTMTAILALAAAEADLLIRSADIIAAMSLEALRGSVRPFDARIHRIRPHPGQAVVAANLRRLLAKSAILKSHTDCSRVQDSYCLRCIPQVHGAVRDTQNHVVRVVETEMASVTDNPLIFAEQGDVISAGNFHGEPIAFAADFLAIALSELASISERRIETLTNPDLSGLPPFLTEDSGLNSGFMMIQVTAASLVSENKIYAHPASVDSIPTSANQEDHVSMGVTAAMKVRRVLENARHVLAIEALCAVQGLDFIKPLKPAPALQTLHRRIRRDIPHVGKDRVMAHEITAVAEMINAGELISVCSGKGVEVK